MINFTPVEFIFVIIGIIFSWQVICFIVYLIGHQNDKLLAKVGLCFIVAFATIFNTVYQGYRLWYAKHYLNAYAFCYPSGRASLITVYMIDELADKFCQDKSAPYHIVKVREGKQFLSAPNKRDIYRGEGGMWHGIPIEKFLKKY